MRIAMIGQKGVPASYGGIEVHVEEIGARLVRRGHDVRVYTRPYYAAGDEPHRGMSRSPRPSIRTKHLDTATHAAVCSLDTLVHPVDLVHFHALGPSALSWLPRLRGTPTVVTLHGLDWEREKWGRMATYLLQRCEFPAAHCPNRTIAVSQTLRRYFEEKYLISPTYIPNGVSDPVPQSPEPLARWGVEPGQYHLFVGRLTPEKGVHLLLEAWPRIGSGKRLVIAGGSAFTDEYVAQLKRDAGPDVVFTDYVHGAELAALYEHAYLMLLPSFLEGLSIVLLEALSHGRCVLVSDIPENVEVTGDVTPRFRNRDVDDLVAQWQALDRDPERVAAHEKRVRAELAHRFTWDNVVDQLEAVYEEVRAGVIPDPFVPPGNGIVPPP